MDTRKPPLSPSVFKCKAGKLNWRMVQSANLVESIRTANTTQIQQILHHLASAQLDPEEVARFRGPALQRLFELAQIGTQFLTGEGLKRSNMSLEPKEEGKEGEQILGWPCDMCKKVFKSEEFLGKHVVRRHQKKPEHEETGIVQEAVNFLQEEMETLKVVSEKQMEETMNGLQYLMERSKGVGRHRETRNSKSQKTLGTVELLQELARSQKSLLEYDLSHLKAVFSASTVVSQSSLETVRPACITAIEETFTPMKARSVARKVEETHHEEETVDVEFEVEITDSSESEHELQDSAKLIGFDIYAQPQYRMLASELINCPVPFPWVKLKTGYSVFYRNDKTQEISYFHPNLKEFQIRYRNSERALQLASELQKGLVDAVPKVSSFEEKYRGRLLHFFRHTSEDVEKKRKEIASRRPLSNGEKVEIRTELYQVTKAKMGNLVNVLFRVRKDEIESNVELTEVGFSLPAPRRNKQESALPNEPETISLPVHPFLSSFPRKESDQPFSKFFQVSKSSLKHQGTAQTESNSAETWAYKSLRIIGTVKRLMTTSEKDARKWSPGQTFTEGEMCIDLSGRWNGLNKELVWVVRRTTRKEEFDIEMLPD